MMDIPLWLGIALIISALGVTIVLAATNPIPSATTSTTPSIISTSSTSSSTSSTSTSTTSLPTTTVYVITNNEIPQNAIANIVSNGYANTINNGYYFNYSQTTEILLPNSAGYFSYAPLLTGNSFTANYICSYIVYPLNNESFLTSYFGPNDMQLQSVYTLKGQIQLANIGYNMTHKKWLTKNTTAYGCNSG